jgi:hypothetical protein
MMITRLSDDRRRHHRDSHVMVPFARRLVHSVPALASLALFFPRPASATCFLPQPKIVWSYPADGEVDVPTNARIFVLGTSYPPLGAALIVNGVLVHPDESKPGIGPVLAPHTEYVVALEPSTRYPDVVASFRFTTGAGPVAPELPPLPTVFRTILTQRRALSPECTAAVNTMDCFDTGQDTHLVFETTARPLLFIVVPLPGTRSVPWAIAWPGTCGDPEVFIASGNVHPSCSNNGHRIWSVSRTGELRTADPSCPPSPSLPAPPGTPVLNPPPAQLDPPYVAGSIGCSISRGAPGGRSPAVALLALSAARARIRRGPRKTRA